MGFFDRKEEVIEVQLTQFGKHLLSIGKFKPDQYAFFDDDILYDIKHSATGSATDSNFDSKERTHISEKQNTSESRIKETPRIKTQYNFTDLENRRGTSQTDYQTDCGTRTPPQELVDKLASTWYSSFTTDKNSDGFVILDTNELQTTNLKDIVQGHNEDLAEALDQLIQDTHRTNNFNLYSQASSIADCLYQKRLSDTKYYPYIAPLGNSSVGGNFAPAWSVKFLNGDLLSEDPYDSVVFLSGTNYPDMKIPQLETRVQYDTYIAKKNLDGTYKNNYAKDDIGFSGQLESSQFRDNTVIQVKSDYLMLEIDELNTDFIKENFEIEVFKVEETVNDGNINRELTQLYFYDADIEEDIMPYHVEYYFDLFIDEEIESKFYCNSKNVDKKQNILSDQKIPFNCEDVPSPQFENVYKIEVNDEDFKEPC